MVEYSTQNISPILINELKLALKSVSPYGSVEVHVQDNVVTQITVRNIKKTTGLRVRQALPSRIRTGRRTLLANN